LVDRCQDLRVEFAKFCARVAEAQIALDPPLYLRSIWGTDVVTVPVALLRDDQHSGGVQLTLRALAVLLSTPGASELERPSEQRATFSGELLRTGQESAGCI
jgi:hypothetical protein